MFCGNTNLSTPVQPTKAAEDMVWAERTLMLVKLLHPEKEFVPSETAFVIVTFFSYAGI